VIEEVRAEDGSGMFNEHNQPIVGIDWYAAYHYARWVGLRLPTECEWEKAASWDPWRKVKTTYPWGDQIESSRANVSNPSGRLAPVDAYPSGRSAVGCYNMIGNAAEWVDDWYVEDYYRTMPAKSPQPPAFVSAEEAASSGKAETRLKVMRGGCGNFFHKFRFEQDRFTAYARVPVNPELRNINVGFRCARLATPEEIEREAARQQDNPPR
jgi:formylglycine-generating enzyme required for sulfatase activity